MKKLGLLSMLFLLVGLLVIPCGVAEEDGWVKLFNGKDLKGWKTVHDVDFAVVDGNLRLNTGMGWLRTENEYTDFVVEYEVKALKDEDYDSGFFFRVGLEGKPWPKDGWQVNIKHDGLGTLVRGYRGMIQTEIEKVPVGTWMKFRITVKGENAFLEFNGKKIWEADFIAPEKGYLGIQAENKSFDFRNIRIRPLK
jgi:hypothetical protein